MDKSYFSETEEDQNELLLFLFNNTYDCYNLMKMDKLEDFINEKQIKSLMLEM